jgi:hypothetical protein
MSCLITGCELVLFREGRWVHGDLHEAGSAVVFNAVLGEGGEAAWTYEENLEPIWDSYRNCCSIIGEFPYFERRGVIVFDKYHLALNPQAGLYTKRAPSPIKRKL